MNQQQSNKLWHEIGLEGSPLSLGGGLYGKVATITPDIASRILMKMNGHNRKMKDASSKCWAEDIVEGRWTLTNASICFGDDGQMADGQNRSQASVLSNMPIQTLVILGISKEARLCIDQNVPRNVSDAISISGSEKNPKSAPVVKKIHQGGGGLHNKISNPYCIELMEHYTSVTDWLDKNVPNVPGVTTAIARAAIGRAYVSIRDNKRQVALLKRFLSVLEDGQYAEKDENVLQNAGRIRDILMRERMYGGRQVLAYRLMQYAIRQTLLGKVITKWPGQKKMRLLPMELFPFPQEIEAAKAREVEKKKDTLLKLQRGEITASEASAIL